MCFLFSVFLKVFLFFYTAIFFTFSHSFHSFTIFVYAYLFANKIRVEVTDRVNNTHMEKQAKKNDEKESHFVDEIYGFSNDFVCFFFFYNLYV